MLFASRSEAERRSGSAPRGRLEIQAFSFLGNGEHGGLYGRLRDPASVTSVHIPYVHLTALLCAWESKEIGFGEQVALASAQGTETDSGWFQCPKDSPEEIQECVPKLRQGSEPGGSKVSDHGHTTPVFLVRAVPSA